MYQVTTKRRSFPLRGPTSSKQLNDFVDQVCNDMLGVNNQVFANEIAIREALKILVDETRHLKRRTSQLEAVNRAKDIINGRNGLRITHHQSAYDVGNLLFFNNDLTLKPHVNPVYGIVTLPSNGIESKFFFNSIYSGEVVVPASLTVNVTDTFANPGETVPTKHEAGGKVMPGNPRNAFNGVNQSYWIREVEVSADSDVNEVQVQLTVTIPNQNNSMSNVMVVHPYPIGTTDIMEIAISPDLTSSFTSIAHPEAPSPGSPVTNAGELFFVFQPQDIDQVRIRLRQRNFTLENGKKIFRYGLQELGLFLIDFEKQTSSLTLSNWVSNADNDNITLAYKVDAPEKHFFTAIHYFSSEPDFSLEDTDRHVLYRIYDGDPTSGVAVELWNSTETLPQNQPATVGRQIAITGTVTSLYVAVSLRYVHTSGGINSPYPANTSPYIKGFTVEYSVSPMF